MDIAVRSSLLVVLALGIGCSGGPSGKPAPDFRVEQAEPPAKEVKLSGLKGKVVLVDFWATWCGPCKETMPRIEALYQKYRAQGLEVMAISNENRAVVRGYRPRSGVTYPFYVDIWNEANMRFEIQTLPQLFLVDRKGKIVFHEEGAGGDEAPLVRAIESALAEK